MKIYQVVHSFDVDGGFGDAVPQSEVIVTTTDSALAKNYVKMYSREFVYDVPYSVLKAGLLSVVEIDIPEYHSLNDMPVFDSHYIGKPLVFVDEFVENGVVNYGKMKEEAKRIHRERLAKWRYDDEEDCENE